MRELNDIFLSERTILETHADGTTLCPQLTALAATRLTFIAFFHHHGGGGRSFVCVLYLSTIPSFYLFLPSSCAP